ncbi:MAG: hypothetical protein HEEMFOPI_00924 [Holosporales bacterium]
MLKQKKTLFILTVFFWVVCCFYDPWIQPDSYSYMDGSVCRGPLYPFFLNSIFFVFGKNYKIVVIFQTVIGFMAIFYTTMRLKEWFNLKKMIQIIVLLILAFPYIKGQKIGSTILTEPVCYPLFLVFTVSFFESFKLNILKPFYLSLILAILLVLIRKQFMFVFGVYYVMVFLNYLKTRKISLKKTLLPFLAFLVAIALEHFYVYSKIGEFKSTPFSICYVAAPLFVAKEINNESLISDNEKKFLKSILKQRESLRIGFKNNEFREEYQENSVGIPYTERFAAVHDIYRYQLVYRALKETNVHPKLQDEFIKNISFKLIGLNISDFFKIYKGNIIQGIGGSYSLLIVIFMIFFGIGFYLKTKNIFSLFMGIIAVLHLSNIFLTAFLQPIIDRYSFYTENFFKIAILLLFVKFYDTFLRKDVKTSDLKE